ncbi:hypothetical protein CkaCkLH20_10263 [Colletotrichum karsti]|uniref:Zn(2)-C6 fungal-type domain-containing protein n=1 Tax=Colletotrichum karsti TaxID=1095194 RepID=A0A9P6HZQ3_9PEZI|nr:uncharacterized protein CkaCkLH20_10263 [Colletotrichum karsti]KAF9872171.1 hypothetical protein CkaCkLH20_10263 [Colletotrichum karsti]
MDRRTYESPMEWEYQDRGPLDATSPFSQVAKSSNQNIFNSPNKFASSRPNLFASSPSKPNSFANSPSKPNPFANSPSKPLPSLPPQTSLFSPRIQSSHTAPPFRNPAFTTPRKPFDESAFSEASGAESSPALTENSEFPDDTPDVDRFADANMGTVTPSKVDKSHRYGKAGLLSSKRHAPGKGEIPRGARDYPAIRKRKRHNLDRDVGGSARYHGSQDWDSEEDSEDDEHRQGSSRSKNKKKRNGRSWIGNLFYTLEEHPNAPENLYRWIQLLVNCIIVSAFVFFCWSILDTVRSDIRNANDVARQEIESKMAECRSEYQLNECAKKDRPALKAMCDEWYECMIQDPSAIMRVRVTVKQIAEILNEFAGAMQVKAWVFFFGILLLCIVANNLTLGRLANTAAANRPAPAHRAASGAPEPSVIPEPSQAYMWVPIQTPSHRRHLKYDSDATDTDASPPKMKSIMPPRTPSGRRSPSKVNLKRASTADMEEASGGQSQAQPGADAASSAGASSAPAPTPAPAPAPTPSAPTPAGTSGPGQLSKRRRGLGVVTPNACTECRKKRAKCDGHKPCGRCKAQKDVECVYEIPVRQSKEHLRTEIEQLRQRQRSSDQVIAALVRSDMWEDVLQRLRNGQSLESVSEWLGGTVPSGGGARPSFGRQGESSGDAGASSGARHGFPGPAPIRTRNLGGPGSVTMSPITGQSGLRQDLDPNSPWHLSSHSQSTRSNSHPDLMNWSADTNRPPQGPIDTWPETASNTEASEGGRYQGLDQVLAPLELPDMKLPPENWTNITEDGSLVQHLLALYFCWEYPTFASLSKEHFLRDFQNGVHRYCSPILVNGLLALGCRFSSKSSTRANPNDPYTSGDHFFKEAQRLFYLEEDHHRLTTIQALGIMSIREASCGRDSESWYYAGQSIRLAIEMGLHQLQDEGDDDEFAVQAATFWGAFALDHAWSLATGSLPQCSCFPLLPPKPAIIDDIEASLWIPYTDDGESSTPLLVMHRSAEQPSNVRSVYKCFCELSELVHQSLYILHSPGRPLTSRDLLGIYTQYLNWYDRIPEVLRLGHNFTPAVLFAHMYYHFAILLLFRPLIKLRIIGSKLLPRDVCSQAADAIQGLLRSYSQLYTLRRTPSFVPYFVLTSAIMHLAIGASRQPTAEAAAETPHPPRVVEAIKQGIRDLEEMAPCHHFAEQALNILRYLAKKWGMNVDMGQTPRSDAEYAHLVRPYTSSLNFFAPNVIEDDFICLWGGGADESGEAKAAMGSGREGSPSVSRAAQVMENPLFWPFPMQGRPMLPTGRELEEAGFERL